MREVLKSIEEELKAIKPDCAVAAVSGGVDSVTSALLAYRVLGNVVKPVIIDTGFMRLNEVEGVVGSLRGLMPLEAFDASSEFYRALMGISDAEAKRVAFRETFYTVLSRIVKSKGCSWLIQGTIAPDWIETRGGIKTQHNVLVQIGIDPLSKYGIRVIEPLRELYKDEVRAIARLLGVPGEIINRQPFPGPGLSIRAVGRLTPEKLKVVREATHVVEDGLKDLGLSQWFAASWEDEFEYDEDLTRRVRGLGNLEAYLFKVRATGVKGDLRAYGPVALVRGQAAGWETIYELYRVFLDTPVTHVIYEVKSGVRGRFFTAIRAVVTEDFMTADVARLSRDLLVKVSGEVLNIDGVSAVGLDISPKPPATIEVE